MLKSPARPAPEGLPRAFRLVAAIVLCTAVTIAGCQCDEKPLSEVDLQLVFPLDGIPSGTTDPVSDFDDCYPERPGSGLIAEIPAISNRDPNTLSSLGLGDICVLIEVINENVGDPLEDQVIGTCRLQTNPDVVSGDVAVTNDRFLSIAALGFVSVRAKVYAANGNLLYSGHSNRFPVTPYDNPAMVVSTVRVAMSMQNHPYCHAFHCDGDCAEGTPLTGPFTTGRTTTLHEPRAFHAALALGDGRVLISGGQRIVGAYDVNGAWGVDVSGGVVEPEVLDSIEIYDAHTGLFELLPNRMSTPRAGHTMIRLDDEEVLVYGGTEHGFAYGVNSNFDRPFRLHTWWPSDATTPAVEIINVTTGMSRAPPGISWKMRVLNATAVLGQPPRAVTVAGIGTRTGDCGAMEPLVPDTMLPHAPCLDAAALDATDKIGAGPATLRLGAAADVIGSGANSYLSIIGGNIDADPTAALAEFRGSDAIQVGAGTNLTPLETALDMAFPSITFDMNQHTLIHATLTTLLDTGGNAKALLFGGDVFDRTAGVVAGAGLCDIQAADCTAAIGSYVPGDCTISSGGAPGATRSRPVAVLLEYDLTGPSLLAATPFSGFMFSGTEPSSASSFLPGSVYHAATALPDAKILITGGMARRVLEPSRAMLLYDDAVAARFSIPTEWECPRHFLEATECEFEENIGNGFDPIRCLFDNRLGHTATLVSDTPGDAHYGLVLIAGGVSSTVVELTPPFFATASVEYLDLRASAEEPTVAGTSPCTLAVVEPGPANACQISTIRDPN